MNCLVVGEDLPFRQATADDSGTPGSRNAPRCPGRGMRPGGPATGEDQFAGRCDAVDLDSVVREHCEVAAPALLEPSTPRLPRAQTIDKDVIRRAQRDDA